MPAPHSKLELRGDRTDATAEEAITLLGGIFDRLGTLRCRRFRPQPCARAVRLHSEHRPVRSGGHRARLRGL